MVTENQFIEKGKVIAAVFLDNIYIPGVIFGVIILVLAWIGTMVLPSEYVNLLEKMRNKGKKISDETIADKREKAERYTGRIFVIIFLTIISLPVFMCSNWQIIRGAEDFLKEWLCKAEPPPEDASTPNFGIEPPIETEEEKDWLDEYLERAVNEVIPYQELEMMSSEELRLLRNGILAFHGRIYSGELKEVFEQYSWYDPRFNDNNFDWTSLNRNENTNILNIKDVECRRK